MKTACGINSRDDSLYHVGGRSEHSMRLLRYYPVRKPLVGPKETQRVDIEMRLYFLTETIANEVGRAGMIGTIGNSICGHKWKDLPMEDNHDVKRGR
jgi:hypothetical protein